MPYVASPSAWFRGLHFVGITMEAMFKSLKEVTEERMMSLEKIKCQFWCDNVLRWAWSLRGKGDTGLHRSPRITERKEEKKWKEEGRQKGSLERSRKWSPGYWVMWFLPTLAAQKSPAKDTILSDTGNEYFLSWWWMLILKKGLNFTMDLKWYRAEAEFRESLRGWEAQTTTNCPLLGHTSLMPALN